MRKYSLAAALALSAIVAPAAMAQDVADPALTTVPVEDDDDDFPWGLLGLLGLAGLLGRNRKDAVRDDRIRP